MFENWAHLKKKNLLNIKHKILNISQTFQQAYCVYSSDMPGGRGDTLVAHKPVDACLSIPFMMVQCTMFAHIFKHFQTSTGRPGQAQHLDAELHLLFILILVFQVVCHENICKYALYLFI